MSAQVAPQETVPGRHWQLPPVHERSAPQWVPHSPQLAASLDRSTHAALHSTSTPSQPELVATHEPFTHASSSAQAREHPPQ